MPVFSVPTWASTQSAGIRTFTRNMSLSRSLGVSTCRGVNWASGDTKLTLAGIGSAPHLRWDNDPRQEVPLAAEPTQDALHALCEVADAPSMAGSLVVRVVDGASVELVDVAIGTTTRVALVDWRPGLLTRAAVVVPAGDEVTVTEVVRAAVRVSNGRVPVRLGW